MVQWAMVCGNTVGETPNVEKSIRFDEYHPGFFLSSTIFLASQTLLPHLSALFFHSLLKESDSYIHIMQP